MRRKKRRRLDGHLELLRGPSEPTREGADGPLTAAIRRATGSTDRYPLRDPELRTPELLKNPEIREHARRALDSIMRGGEKR